MAITRPFAYNPTPAIPISGTTNVGNICIGVSALDYSSKPGGLRWWMGPDEENSYVICKDVSSQTFPTPVGDFGGVQFWRCTNTAEAFRSLVQAISGTSQASALAASAWLLAYGYWTNYDAQAFINAAGITNTTQKTAIDALVAGLKADGLWTKMLAVYPFIGGSSSTTHKWNLKDPRDTNDAFRLDFVSTWTFSDFGATPNGTNAYANTFLAPSVNLSLGTENGSSISHYSRTNSVNPGTPYGTKAGGYNSSINLTLNVSGTNVYHNTNLQGIAPSPAPTTTAINLIQSRVNSTQTIVALNGTAGTYSQNELALSSAPIYLAARNLNNGGIDLPYGRQFAFAHIGKGLTTSECTQLYNRIQAFQTTLGRNNV